MTWLHALGIVGVVVFYVGLAWFALTADVEDK
jgi:hypothetical protein